MQEARGSQLLKRVDRYVGGILLALLSGLLRLKALFRKQSGRQPQTYLVICLGAIGDLILLTEAVRVQLAGERIVLACSKANLGCAQLYQNFYSVVEVVDIRALLSVSKICKKYAVEVVFDSTQWANIGPVQVGLARLLGNGLKTIGFKTKSYFRNQVYDVIVRHSNDVHEVANFMNLLAGQAIVNSNDVLPVMLPVVYKTQLSRVTRNVLFHMWPSGTRAYLKEWPEAYWIDLAEWFERGGYSIYLSGAPADKTRNDAFIAKAGLLNLVNIAGAYDLQGLSAFIANEIKCVVSVNTGILHLAASLGVMLIGLHGPTNPVRWGPLGANSVSLLPESGSFAYLNYGFEYPQADAAAYALDKLMVQQVIDAFERQLLARNT